MSTLKVDAIRHNSATSDAITTATDGTCTARITSINGGSALSHRNVLINGAMTISQRGTTFSHLGSSNTNVLTMDRWKVRRSGSEFDTTITQSTDSPDGFANSLKITPDAVETPSGSQNGLIMQQPEGQSLQHFAYGTSSAKSVTVSFYAKSGSQNNGDTYSFQMRKYDSSNNTKIVTKAFTVTSSWQRFTMTFAGDTSNDIKNSTDYQGFEFIFHLATGPDDLVAAQPTWTSTFTNWRGVTGQSNFMDNTNNEFYVTGCQLEVGDTATTFEHRSFSEELLRCQRYYCKSYNYSVAPGTATFEGAIHGRNYDTTGRSAHPIFVYFPSRMRANPSMTFYAGDGQSGKYSTGSTVGGTDLTTENNFGTSFINSESGIFHCNFSDSVPGTNLYAFQYTADAEV